MRGISEERLKQIAHDSRGSGGTNMLVLSLLDMLLSECKELNEWKPIDENTPTHKQILLFYPEHKTPDGKLKPYITATRYNELSKIVYIPTHWQELPEPPKD